ncbi:hypothetical protein ZEAMMB73_Zm00001d001872 [Zea mays]|uniref:Uncharacterized protein n=1 Tax=Zea mays TaxID=4577 RepID=A0A1D6DTS5_MAIZE|nr:hypothetical protein ZEAMMB73_Zm00001d036747 [Zea mays]AQK81845.1 hypothetical protein ZEAMMB73_Zm00001d036747 [Zea mays]ONM12245.1 hypothetical protein ZEAMMB73_Zm00001d001872 [Zea mays]ONM12246.1 hypothetical protein ZEAMMB73_Zm00001d001872 [Zea mays]
MCDRSSARQDTRWRTFQELFMLVGPTTSLGPEKKCNQPIIVCGPGVHSFATFLARRCGRGDDRA